MKIEAHFNRIRHAIGDADDAWVTAEIEKSRPSLRAIEKALRRALKHVGAIVEHGDNHGEED